MKRVCCPRNLVYEASFRKRKRRKENSLPSKFSKPKSKLDDLFTKLVIGVRASHGKRVTRTCERRFLPATQRRARAIRTRHRDSNDLRHPDRGPERGNINGIKVRAYKKYVYLFTLHRLRNTCNRYTRLRVIVCSVMQKLFEYEYDFFFFLPIFMPFVRNSKRKRTVFIIQIDRVTIFSFSSTYILRFEQKMFLAAQNVYSPFFFFFVTNDGGMEKSGLLKVKVSPTCLITNFQIRKILSL